MKISFHDKNQNSKRGSVLLITLGFIVCCGISMAAYYALVEQEHRQVARSQNWNGSLTLAESGVDEALAQMNASPGDFSANSWGGMTGTGGTYGPVTRTLSGGTYGVEIVGGTPPTIYATGYVAVADTSQTISRKVKVTTTISQTSPFDVALGAVTNINMNGNKLITDSYNSTNSALSTAGQYDSSKTSTNGSIASVGGIVNVGNHVIDGSLYLGPDATYTSGAGQILGTIYNDYNVNFPPATLPTTDSSGNSISWLNAPGTSSAHNFTTSGYYTVNDSGTITVAPGVTVTLQVTTQNFNPSSITLNGGITNSGSIIMYDNPSNPNGSITVGGNSSGGATGNRPGNFVIFGLDNLSSITLSGTSDFNGAIYAPEATLTMNGGGSGVNVSGSLIVGQATDNGHYYIHYDEALAHWNSGPNRGYIATSWQEL